MPGNESIVTAEARSLLVQLKSENAIPSNKPTSSIFREMGRTCGEEEDLADRGVPVEAEANRNIRELERPVKEFADKYLNCEPTLEAVSDILQAIRALYNALSKADADGVHPNQRDYGWHYLAAACARIARTERLSHDDEPGAFAGSVLLQASFYPEPTHNPEFDAQFDKNPHWGVPAARIEAANGLIVLARHPTCAGPHVLEAVERLSKDPVPAVRFQVAAHTIALYRIGPELMRKIIENMCREEPSRGVLLGLLGGTLGPLAGAEPSTRQLVYRLEEIFR
jgi:hypothetical protein